MPPWTSCGNTCGSMEKCPLFYSLFSPFSKDKNKGTNIRRIGSQKFRWIAAASIVGLLGVAVFVWNVYKTGKADGLTEKSSEVLSTIIVPKGEQRNIVLPDGSKVWLNSASTF